jgi:guanine deaminase
MAPSMDCTPASRRGRRVPDMDESYLRRAIDLALENVAAGDQPFGAVVVAGGEIVGEGVNSVERSGDPTDHAEVVAIRAACIALGRLELPDAMLYSSAQPCPMCAGAALLVGISRTVYATDGSTVAGAGLTLPKVGIAAQAALRTVPGAGIEHARVPGADEPFQRWLDRRPKT